LVEIQKEFARIVDAILIVIAVRLAEVDERLPCVPVAIAIGVGKGLLADRGG
jgi:hypothetical protein